MLTLKLKIRNTINVTDWCENYSYAFRELYKNFELSQDKGFVKNLIKKHKLDSWLFESLKIDVSSKLEQGITFNKKNINRIEELKLELEKNNFTGTKGKRRKYKLIKNIHSATASIGKGITFGTRALLQRISFLSNCVLDKQKLIELAAAKEKYKKSRVLPISIVGEAPQGSNRKFDFNLKESKVVFKPIKGTKILIEFYCSKAQQKILDEIQEMIGSMAISIRLNNEYIWISYDEEKLNGMAFDKDGYFRELKTIDKKDLVARKECYKKYIAEQDSRKFFGKNINRYLSVDLNPEYIGVSVIEKITDNNFKIIHKEVICLKGLNTRNRLSSTNPKQVYQNNKRVHEINESWNRISKLTKHYKVANFVMEDLNFKAKTVNDNSKEANRQTKNIWHRELTTKIIQKNCNIIGLKLILVNPCYSSFIGNIKYKFFDPLSSAIEIGRRGITKYLKGGFYPTIEKIDFDTMNQLGLDVQSNTVSSWVKAFQLFKTAKLRYRKELKNFVENNLSSCKSSVKIYSFNTI